MLRIPVLCVVVVCCALVPPPAAIGQTVSPDDVPDGLTATDWSSIKAAYAAHRHAMDRDEEGGKSYSQGSGSIAQQAYLKASNTGWVDYFGFSVAVSGDTVVVGAYREDSIATGVNGNQGDNSAFDAGAAYVFLRSGTSWSQQAYLKASNTEAGDQFGESVAVSGDTVVVGAQFEDSNATGVNGNQGDNGASSAGAAYVFVRNGTNWSQQAYLKASNTEAIDFFGSSVAVSGDTVLVGAGNESSNATGVDGDQGDNSANGAGAAYVFLRSGTSWSQQAYLKASNTELSDFFGYSVAVSGDTVVVGAYGEDSNAAGVDGDQDNNFIQASGAAYVFVRGGTSWSQQAYLKASNTGTNDEFGGSVAVWDDTVVVGAYREDSNATGVDGDQANNSAMLAGAAYVFVRSETSWSQQGYLKASNTDASDRFGYSVAVSGDTVLVGAYWEDSNATGVNGNQNNNFASDSGAAYVFARSGTSWSQQDYLKARNTGVKDRFGWSVAVSGDTVVVGATGEDSNASGVDGDMSDNSSSESGAAYVFDLEAWADMGCALAGVSGDPLLVGTGPLADGSSNSIDLSNAAPSAPCGLFVALSSTPVPFKGGTLKPFPFLLGPIILATSPIGTLPLPFTMPSGLPSGTTLWFQYGIQDASAIFGVSLSNAIVGTTP